MCNEQQVLPAARCKLLLHHSVRSFVAMAPSHIPESCLRLHHKLANELILGTVGEAQPVLLPRYNKHKYHGQFSRKSHCQVYHWAPQARPYAMDDGSCQIQMLCRRVGARRTC
jgi:hypothetical protein